MSSVAAAQNPYARLNDAFRSLFDPIPIDNGQAQQFFDYAVQLYQRDSLKKAGQLFDRVYWLDTASFTGRQSLLLRKQIEEKVIRQTRENLNSGWIWNWSGTNWGADDTPAKSKTTRRIELDGSTIMFYRNDSLVRQSTHTLTQTFTWVDGFLANEIKFEDTKEAWYFTLTGLDSFTADRLWVEKKSKFVCGNYGECYLLDKARRLPIKKSPQGRQPGQPVF